MNSIHPPADATPYQGNILIVDDTPDNLHLLSKILSLKGYEVRAVTSGCMALTVAKVAPPEIILLDIRMPQMDGYEVCRLLKADPTTQHIPVIFLSALTEIEDKTDAFDVGGVDYITKPFRMAEVVARVKTHLTLCRLQQALKQKNQLLQQKVYYQETADHCNWVERRVLEAITARLQGTVDSTTEFLTNVSILVASLVDSAVLTKKLSPSEWIQLVNRVCFEVDEWVKTYELDLIRANGTEWMVVAGARRPGADHVEVMAEFAIALNTSLAKLCSSEGQPLQVRIGIHAGEAVAGVMGAQKLTYDLWGETVELAQQVHRQAIPSKILVSSTLYPPLQGRYLLEEQGRIEEEPSGALQTYWLKGKRK